MVIKQFYLGCLAHASYMIADEDTKIAAVIDPQRDIHRKQSGTIINKKVYFGKRLVQKLIP